MRKTTGLLVLATSVLWASLAGAAELGTMTFRILKKVGEGQYDTMTDEERDQLFSLSNCTCNTLFAVEMTLRDALQAQTSPDDVQIWVGSNCNEFSTERDQRCFRVDDISVQSFDGRLVRIEIPVRKMVEPTAADGAACREVAAQQTIWALVDEGNDGSSYEHAWSINPAVAVDSEPPPLPVSPEARGNEDGITLSWTKPEAETEDIFGYQVLCARTDGSPLFTTPPAEPSYQTPFAMCGVGEDSFERLSPRFVCSGELSASATSARISLAGVTLGPTEQIQTRLVVFDRARNAREVPISGTARPSPNMVWYGVLIRPASSSMPGV